MVLYFKNMSNRIIILFVIIFLGLLFFISYNGNDKLEKNNQEIEKIDTSYDSDNENEDFNDFNNYDKSTETNNLEIEDKKDVKGFNNVNNDNKIIEVVHFHGTRQCWACIKVGELAFKTIKEEFLDEYNNGIIIFLDINGELPENKEIVKKYQARGSSLFINRIINGNDNIVEDVNVWRLIYNENEFINYFKDKLSS